MTAFAIIPAWLDPYELACSLRERMGSFGESKRGRRVWSPDADERWPELNNLLGRIERLAMFQPLNEAARLYLEMLDPGAIMGWRTRDDAIARETMRLYLPLIGSPAIFWYGPGQVIQPVLGQLVGCNTRIPHSAANFGDCPRVAMVIDARPRRTPDPQRSHAPEPSATGP